MAFIKYQKSESAGKGEASYANLIEHARNAKGGDRDGLRAEFIRLAEAAELLPKSFEKPKRKVKASSVEVEVDI